MSLNERLKESWLENILSFSYKEKKEANLEKTKEMIFLKYNLNDIPINIRKDLTGLEKKLCPSRNSVFY